jgi:hypothetical protein
LFCRPVLFSNSKEQLHGTQFLGHKATIMEATGSRYKQRCFSSENDRILLISLSSSMSPAINDESPYEPHKMIDTFSRAIKKKEEKERIRSN